MPVRPCVSSRAIQWIGAKLASLCTANTSIRHGRRSVKKLSGKEIGGWWRWRESNPRPKNTSQELLRVYPSILSLASVLWKKANLAR